MGVIRLSLHFFQKLIIPHVEYTSISLIGVKYKNIAKLLANQLTNVIVILSVRNSLLSLKADKFRWFVDG